MPPSHLQSLPSFNTVARSLRNIRPPTDPPFYAIHHTILVMAISCKGQVTAEIERWKVVLGESLDKYTDEDGLL